MQEKDDDDRSQAYARFRKKQWRGKHGEENRATGDDKDHPQDLATAQAVGQEPAEELESPVQVDGRLRARLRVPAEIDEDELRERALAEPRVAQCLSDREVARVVVVPGRLVNIVSRANPKG